MSEKTPKTSGTRPFLKKGEGVTGKYKVAYPQIGKAVATSTPKGDSINYFGNYQNTNYIDDNHQNVDNYEKYKNDNDENININNEESSIENFEQREKICEISDTPDSIKSGLKDINEFIIQKKEMPKVYTPSNITDDSTSTMGYVKNRYAHLLHNSDSSSQSYGTNRHLDVVVEEETPVKMYDKKSDRKNDKNIIHNLADQLRDLIVHIDYASLQLRSRQDLYETMRQQKFEAQVTELDKQMEAFQHEKITLLEKQTKYQKLVQKQRDQIDTLNKDKDSFKGHAEKLKELISTKDTRIANLRSRITQLENSLKEKVDTIMRYEKKQARRSLPSLNNVQRSPSVSDIIRQQATEILNQTLLNQNLLNQNFNQQNNDSTINKNVRWRSPVASLNSIENIYPQMKLSSFDVDSKGNCITTYTDNKNYTTKHIVKTCDCEHYEYCNGDRRWEHSTGKFHMYYYGNEGITSLFLTEEWKLLYHSTTGQIDLYKNDGQIILIQQSGDRVEFSRKNVDGSPVAEVFKGKNKYTITPTTTYSEIVEEDKTHYADGSYIARRSDNSVEFVSAIFALRRDPNGNAKLSIVVLDIQISLLIQDVICAKHVNKTLVGITKTVCCLWGKNSHLVENV